MENKIKQNPRINNFKISLEAIHNNSLNTSLSKMQFTFCKSARFPEDANIIKANFYQIGNTLSKRSATIGSASKENQMNKSFAPSPNLYNLKSDFDNKKGISIGLGRDDVKNISLFPKQPINQLSPQSYQPKYLQKSIKYSIRQKLIDKSNKQIESFPGPGTYNQIQLINQKCTNFISKFQNVPSSRFPKLIRQGIELNPQSPGPAKYDTSNQFKTISKFNSKKMYSFGHSKRQGILYDSITPGPGTYKYFSEFLH